MEYEKDGQRRTPRNQAEARALRAAGWTPVVAVVDTSLTNELRVRSATAEEATNASTPGLVARTGEVDDALEATRSVELRRRDAQSSSEQLLAGGSALLSGLTLGASTALGIDSRTGLTDETRDILRSETGAAEAVGMVGAALSPVGAEALAARGASWLGGNAVRRFATEGAMGGAFNALQEAMIARNPDVFAERLLGDAGIGALFGAGIGAPFAGASRLARMARGTPAAQANRELMEAAAEMAGGPMSIDRIASIEEMALNPATRAGRVQAGIAGAAAPRGIRGEMDAFEATVSRHRSRTQAELSQVTGDVASQYRALRDARGVLSDLDPNSTIPTAGLADDAVDQARGQLRRLQEDLAALDAPGSRIDDFGNGGQRVTRRVATPITRAIDTISEAANISGATTPAQALRQIYGMPRAISEAVSGLSAADRDILDAMISSRGLTEGTSPLLRGGGVSDIVDGMDSLLGGEMSPFGEAGQMLMRRRGLQRQVEDALSGIREKFDLTGSGEVLDSNVFRRLVSQAENTGNVEGIRRLAAARDIITELQQSSRLFPELGRIADGVTGSSQTLDDFMTGAYATATASKIAQREAEAAMGQQAMRQMVSGTAIAGAALAAGPAGLAGGLALSGLAAVARSPFSMSRMYSRVRNAFSDQAARVGRSLDTTAQVAQSTSRRPFIRNLSPRAGTLAAAVINGSHEEKVELYDELVSSILRMQEDPTAMANALMPQTEVLGDHMPGLNTAVGMQGHRQLAALSAALPLSARAQNQLRQLSAPPPIPSTSALNEFLQVAAVIEDPIFGVDLMNAGRLSRGSAAAIATAFPNFHEEVSARIISDMASAAQRQRRTSRRGIQGPRVNYQASLMMSRFVGFPLDSTMEAGFQAAVTSQAAQTTEQDSAQFSRPVSTREPTFLQQEQTVTGRIGS